MFDAGEGVGDVAVDVRSHDSTGSALSALAASAQTGAVLSGVDAVDVDTFAVVELVAAWHRMVGWAQAGMAAAAAELDRRVRPFEAASPVASGRRSGAVPRAGAAAQEIAMRLGISRAAAQGLVDAGLAFEQALAPVGEALAEGLIDLPRARAFVEGLSGSPLQTAVDVQEAVLPAASGRTVVQVRRDIAAALIGVDPPEATRRHRLARDRRRVNRPMPLPDGMAGMYAMLPAVDLAALDIALDAAARTAKAGGDERSIDQLRADALAGVGHHALAVGWIGAPPAPSAQHTPRPTPAPTRAPAQEAAHEPAADKPASWRTADEPASRRTADEPAERAGEQSADDGVAQARDAAVRAAHAGSAPESHSPCSGAGFRLGVVGGRPARVNVTVPLSVLTGSGEDLAGAAADNRWNPASTDEIPPPQAAEVAELDGYGPITPDVARALALGGTWRRLVVDPLSGAVLDVGREQYKPPPDLADLVRARDKTCVRPGCSVPAARCDLDHTIPYHLGGTTAAPNLGALCPGDHAHKSIGTYRVEQPEPGVFDFHLPSGHSYRRMSDGTTTPLTRPLPAVPRPGPGRPAPTRCARTTGDADATSAGDTSASATSASDASATATATMTGAAGLPPF